ncbi:ABC transporter substrate-binding protein [Streptomyces sp. HUAS MG47]|uniref:ABC transporter substrate-binding protein n=1 Tax=Streptomyces solicamelliae TaxID=3231716 RepID=UPI003877F55C
MQELGAADPRQVGRYRILARLGAGGMGRVYLGRSTSGRMVAVKVVRAELAEDPDFRRRFAREIEAARRVTGFFTAAVVDADPEGDPAWLATAYVPGLPLDAAVRAHGAWPRRSLLVLGAGLVEALEAIHATGLIHRDLKPSNVLIAADGPRVIDFGISVATEASVLTRTGTVVGTPGFMSPEQVTGHHVTSSSDVFSLGAVLAFAATGAPPFGVGSPHAVNFRAVYEAPDLQGLPADTDFVGRCLEKDPGGRPTVPELLAEFASLLGETGGQTYGGGLPDVTAWLPEAVALAVTRPAGTDPARADTPPGTPGGAVDGAVGAGAEDGAVGAGAEDGAGSAPTPPDPREALARKPTPAPQDSPVPQDPTVLQDPPVPQDPATPAPATPAVTPTAPPPPPLPPTSPPASTSLPVSTPEPERTSPQSLDGEPVLVSSWEPASPATRPGRPAAARPGGRARARRIVAVAVAAVLVGGGITALVMNLDKDRNDKATGTGDANASSAGFDAAVDKVVSPSSKKGGTLRLATGMDADSWDPARAYYGWVWNMQRLYSRTLLTYDTKPGAKGLGLVPDLAETQPEVSPDGKTYTVRIKSGLTFEDGTPITSQDVKYAIQRTFATDVLSGGPLYFPELLDQGQNYRGPYKDAGGTGLKSIATPDERTLVFRLATPDSRFPHLLAMGATAPVPKSKDTGARYGLKPVASGPYRFDSYSPGKSLVLVRNTHWKPATDPVRKALPDRIELNVSAASEQVATQLMAGIADLDASQAGLSQAASVKVMGDPELRAHADAAFSGALRYVALVSRTAPFDNVHCRKAVLYAADTTALQTAQGGRTAGARHGNMLPPTIPGGDAYDPFDLTTGKPRLARAREELAACGRPKGFSTKLVVRDIRPKEVAAAEALRQALKAAGIQVEIERVDSGQYSGIAGDPSVVETRGYGLIVTGWGSDFPHGSGFLQPLADGRYILPNGNVNHAQVNDPAINTLFDRAAAETDPDKVADLNRTLNHRLTDGAHYLPVAAVRTLNYRNPRLTNVYVSQAYGMVDVQALGVGGGEAG